MKLLNFLKSKSFFISLIGAILLLAVLIFGVMQYLKSYTNQDQKIVVPNLTALNLEEVKVVLEDLELRYSATEAGSYNPKIPKQAVLEQEPVAGDIVKEKRKIYVTINPDGYANAPIPEFYGRTKKEIIQLIINSGFVVGDYEEIDDIGTVVRKLKFEGQEIEAGDMLPKMSTINVVIGNGELK